ncbi:MAG: YkgJ family cysteine cluster protein [Leptolyngbya sp. Prado105]|jgi:Fe-S-cluster containining protein|nr:YkgJ family cysteine cluster protein [Leptolyngbya sp. Prado105]
MDHVRSVLQNLDEHIEARAQAIRAERDWFPCRRGCDHCCRTLAHPPELSQAEWDRVDAAVASLPDAVRAIVEQAIDTLIQKVGSGSCRSTIVCPFLDEQEGACRIYENRPIACRTYGFFVARDHDQYCELVEYEINTREDHTIVWGNAEAIRNQVKQICGETIPFELHYRNRI